MSSLFNFIFNTMQTRVNDVSNQRFWLPGVLEGMDSSGGSGKLLPLTVSEWKVGPISGEAGKTITDSFCLNYKSYLEKVKKLSFANQDVIPAPDTPCPVMAFEQVTINGLQNLRVQPNPPTVSDAGGYHATVTLMTNYYDGTDGKPDIPLFGLSGQYLLSQSLCTASNDNPSVCNGVNRDDIDGRGAFDIVINGAYIQASLTISIEGKAIGRKPVITMTGLQFMGAYEGGAPGFDINSLSIVASVSEYLKNVWVAMSERALTSPEGQTGIFQQINHSLNEPNNLKSISDTITPQLVRALDKLIGETPDGKLPDDSGQQLVNPCDLYMFDRLRFGLDDPAGQWYLPNTVRSIRNPVLEPLHIDGLQLPDQQVDGMSYRQIKLLSVNVTGLSNMQALSKEMIFDVNGALDATVHIGALTGNGQFSLLPDGMDAPLTGGFDLTIQQSVLHFRSDLSGEDASSLTLRLHSAVINADPAVIKLQLHIDSVFRDFINSVLNARGTLLDIMDKLNDVLAGHLDSISQEISKATSKGMLSRLDS